MSSPLIIFLLLLIAVGAFFFGRWFGMSQHSKALSEELKAKDDELSSLRADVNQHFDETARLFSNVTEEYKALYQHLAASSNKLSNRKFDLKLSSNTSGLPGLGNAINKELDDSIIDSEATEISDHNAGPQQPRDYAEDDIDDDYHPKHSADKEENKDIQPADIFKPDTKGNPSQKKQSEDSGDVANDSSDDSSEQKKTGQKPSSKKATSDKSAS